MTLEAPENEGAVSAAEAEIVLDRHVDRKCSGLIRAVIQVALRILVKDIDRGWADLMM